MYQTCMQTPLDAPVIILSELSINMLPWQLGGLLTLRVSLPSLRPSSQLPCSHCSQLPSVKWGLWDFGILQLNDEWRFRTREVRAMERLTRLLECGRIRRIWWNESSE